MLEKKRIKWIKSILNNKKDKYSEIKFISQLKADFGDFEGVQFNSELKGGHIYFWSSGMVNYIIYDYIKDDEIVKDTLVEIKENENLETVLSDFLNNL